MSTKGEVMTFEECLQRDLTFHANWFRRNRPCMTEAQIAAHLRDIERYERRVEAKRLGVEVSEHSDSFLTWQLAKAID